MVSECARHWPRADERAVRCVVVWLYLTMVPDPACCDTRRALAAAGAFCCRVERARSAPAEDGVVVGLDRRDFWEQLRHAPRER